jgi:hypothetical protein
MKTCTRCMLPLAPNEKGGRHYDPDECVRLLRAELAKANAEKKLLENMMKALNELAVATLPQEAL